MCVVDWETLRDEDEESHATECVKDTGDYWTQCSANSSLFANNSQIVWEQICHESIP